MSSPSEVLRAFEIALDDLYIQEQVSRIDQACIEQEDTMSTDIENLLNTNQPNLESIYRRMIQHQRYDRILSLPDNNEQSMPLPVPANQFDEEFGNAYQEPTNSPVEQTNVPNTGSFISVMSNILTHMENEAMFIARTNMINSFDNFNDPVKITLSTHQYDNIPEEIVEKGECSICLEEFDNTLCKKLNCEHYFHPECIKNWLLKQSVNCPVCRSDCRN